MKTKQMKKLFTAFSLLLIITIGFWACRKQDFKADDLQIASKELQTWLATNGGIYNKGELLIKDNKGKLIKASLNWSKLVLIKGNAKNFYEVPFEFISQITEDKSVLTENGEAFPSYTLVVQKANDGVINARVKISFLEDTKITKDFSAKSFTSINIFDDLDGNRKAGFIWVKPTDTKPIQVYWKSNIAVSTNSNLSNRNKLQTNNTNGVGILTMQCDVFAIPNYETQCWADGGIANGTTCAYVVTSYTTWSSCYQSMSNTDLSSFDYSGLFGGSGTGSSTNTQEADEWENKVDADSLKKDPCANAVYSKLKSTHIMYNLLKNFMKEKPVIDLVWDVEPADSLSVPNASAETQLDNYLTNVKITLNQTYLDSASPISIARTMIHESIHAELYRKMVSVGMNPSIKDFPGLFDYYQRYENSSAQHNLMADFYIPLIIQGLKEFDGQQGIDTSSRPLNFYEGMAWGGLTRTDAWNSMDTTTQNAYKAIYRQQAKAGGCK
jgi:hypothetical protein